MINRRGMAGACMALALSACAPVDDDALLAQWWGLDVTATPIAFVPARVGQLVYRGGLALSSDDYRFGGLSGLEVLDGNHFVAISDQATWFEGRLVFDRSGMLTDVADVRFAEMRDEHGDVIVTRQTSDSEDLAQLPDGRFAVSFEQTQRILIYDFNRDGPFGAARPGPVLAEAERLPSNAALEALTATQTGELLAGAEGGGGPTPLWRTRLDAPTPSPPFASYVLNDGFSLTSLDRLPNGDFVALERFYAPVVGASARIATFPASALRQGAMIHPHRLAEIAAPLPIDNFEGISAMRTANGGTRLYIVSDDNFSDRQRTLLFAFDIVE